MTNEFTGASPKEIADQRLAYGAITPAQYNFLARRFNFAPLGATPAAPASDPLSYFSDTAALGEQAQLLGSAVDTAGMLVSSKPAPAESNSTGDLLADYLRDHSDPYPNQDVAESNRTTFPTK